MKKEMRFSFLISILLITVLFSMSFGSAVTNPNAGKVKIMIISNNYLSPVDSSSYAYWFLNYLNSSNGYNMSNIDIKLQSHDLWNVNDFINGRDNLGSVSNWVQQYKPDVVFLDLGLADIYKYENWFKTYNASFLVEQIANVTDIIRAQNPYTVFFISNLAYYDPVVNSYNYNNMIDFNSKLNIKINNKSSWSSNMFIVNAYSNYYPVTLQYPYNYNYNVPLNKFIASSMFNSIKDYWTTCTNYESANFCKSNYWCGAANSTVLRPNVIFPDNLTLPSVTDNRFLCAQDGKIYRCGQDSLQNINATFYLNTFSNISLAGVKKGFFSCTSNNYWQFCNNNSVCESSKGETIQSCPSDCHPTCTFEYNSWSDCASNGIQTRGIASRSPSDCVGGNPILNQSCNYINQTIVIQQTTFCTPNSTVSCDPINYGVRVGYANRCNENGTAYLNISNCNIICNTGFRLVGDACIASPVVLNDSSNSTNQTAVANVPVEDTPYPTYNPIPSNDNNSNNNNQRINYSASINDPSVTELLNIGGSNSSSVDGNTKNSFMTDNQVPIIIIVLIVILALIIFLWIFFKLGAAKDDKKPAANNPVTQNNNFKPRPPMQPRPLLVQRPSGNNRPVVQRIQ